MERHPNFSQPLRIPWAPAARGQLVGLQAEVLEAIGGFEGEWGGSRATSIMSLEISTAPMGALATSG